jgi:putative thioredoxin
LEEIEMLSVTAETFAQEVEQASRERPVVVDFWRTGCAPCAALAPVLERLEAEYASRIKIVKLKGEGVAENALAQRLGIRAVPTLLGFAGGELVHRAVGYRGEPWLREFLDAAATPLGEAHAAFQRGMQYLKAGDRDGGIAALREALEREPGHVEALLTLLKELGRIPGPVDAAKLGELAGEMSRLFFDITDLARQAYPYEIDALQLRFNCLQDLPAMPQADELRERLGAAPNDDWSRITLARRLIAEGDFKEAAEQLLICGGSGKKIWSVAFRNYMFAHVLADTWNDEAQKRPQEVHEWAKASRQKNESRA